MSKLSRMRPARYATISIALLTMTACGGLLDVSNPTLVRDSDTPMRREPTHGGRPWLDI